MLDGTFAFTIKNSDVMQNTGVHRGTVESDRESWLFFIYLFFPRGNAGNGED